MLLTAEDAVTTKPRSFRVEPNDRNAAWKMPALLGFLSLVVIGLLASRQDAPPQRIVVERQGGGKLIRTSANAPQTGRGFARP